MENIQWFIEKYYPKYFSCCRIARWNDLSVILDDEHVEGSIAWEVFMTEHNGSQASVGREYDEINADILEQSIQGYLGQQQPTYFLLGSTAERYFDEEGLIGVIEAVEGNEITMVIYKHNHDGNVENLLWMAQQEGGYVAINAEEYKFLTEYTAEDVARCHVVKFFKQIIEEI